MMWHQMQAIWYANKSNHGHIRSKSQTNYHLYEGIDLNNIKGKGEISFEN